MIIAFFYPRWRECMWMRKTREGHATQSTRREEGWRGEEGGKGMVRNGGALSVIIGTLSGSFWTDVDGTFVNSSHRKIALRDLTPRLLVIYRGRHGSREQAHRVAPRRRGDPVFPRRRSKSVDTYRRFLLENNAISVTRTVRSRLRDRRCVLYAEKPRDSDYASRLMLRSNYGHYRKRYFIASLIANCKFIFKVCRFYRSFT